jgi:hypothetical protein
MSSITQLNAVREEFRKDLAAAITKLFESMREQDCAIKQLTLPERIPVGMTATTDERGNLRRGNEINLNLFPEITIIENAHGMEIKL